MSFTKSNQQVGNVHIQCGFVNNTFTNTKQSINNINTSIKKKKSPGLHEKVDGKQLHQSGTFNLNNLSVGSSITNQYISSNNRNSLNFQSQQHQSIPILEKHHFLNNNIKLLNSFSFGNHKETNMNLINNNTNFDRKTIQRDYSSDEHNINMFLLKQKSKLNSFNNKFNKSFKKYEEEDIYQGQENNIEPQMLENDENDNQKEKIKGLYYKKDAFSQKNIDFLLQKCLFPRNISSNLNEILSNEEKNKENIKSLKETSLLNIFYENNSNKRVMSYINSNANSYNKVNIQVNSFNGNDFLLNSNKTEKNLNLNLNNTQNNINFHSSIKEFIEKEAFEAKKIINKSNFENINYANPIPDRILDAPCLIDDFCQNPLDCSTSNILSVVLYDMVYLWNVKTNETKLLSSYQIPVHSVKWINNGNTLAVGLSDGVVQIWDAEKCSQLRNLKGHIQRVNALEWNEMNLLSGGGDDFIINNDVRIKNSITKAFHNEGMKDVTSIKVNPFNMNIFANSTKDGKIYLWDITKSYNNLSAIHNLSNSIQYSFIKINPMRILNKHKGGVRALSFCPFKKNVLVSGGVDKTLKSWNVETGELLVVSNCNSHIYSINWNKINNELITSHGLPKNQISIWKYPQMIEVGNIIEHSRRPLYCTLSYDKKILFSASAEEKLFIWSIFDNDKNMNELYENPNFDNIINENFNEFR